MLTNEELFLLDLMADFINRRQTSALPEHMEWDLLSDLAKAQEIKALVYSQLASLLTDDPHLQDVNDHFMNSYSQSFRYYQNRIHLLQKIDSAFSSANIPYLIFKGTEISQFYPLPMARSMGDSDLLVHECDKEKAHKLLIGLGMTNTSLGPNEWIYEINGMEFELHSRLMNDDEVGNFPTHKAFMNRCWEYARPVSGSCRFHLDDSYHFVFLLLHLRKHFINSGVGFRQFMDLAVMISACDLDRTWIHTELEKLGLLKFSQVCLAFCQKWFSVALPDSSVCLEQTFYEKTTKQIFKNGVFGFEDEKNQKNYTILRIRNSQHTKAFKFRLFLKEFFPSYHTMFQIPAYAFIKNKPFLLPVAWIYRFFLTIKRRDTKTSLQEAGLVYLVSQNEIEKRESYLRDWGL